MAFNLFKNFLKKSPVLSESELQNMISDLLLEMVWIDGDAHEKEIKHVVHLLAMRYDTDGEIVRRKIDGFKNVTQNDIEQLARQLRDNLPARDRVLLLHDLWAIAKANGVADSYEQKLFHRVAVLLGITENEFLEKCIKI